MLERKEKLKLTELGQEFGHFQSRSYTIFQKYNSKTAQVMQRKAK